MAANRLQACTFLGEATHDVAAGVVISSEAGCAFGTLERRDARSRRDGPPHADRHAHLRGPAATPAGAAAVGPAAASAGRGVIMNRVVARLPESVAELCLVRLGIQVKGLSAWLFARRLRSAILADARRAMAEDAGLLNSESFAIGIKHFGVLQYWRSFDDLDAWSRRPPHSEWWRAAVERMRPEERLRRLSRDLPGAILATSNRSTSTADPPAWRRSGSSASPSAR